MSTHLTTELPYIGSLALKKEDDELAIARSRVQLLTTQSQVILNQGGCKILVPQGRFSPNDPAMGAADRAVTCSTCGQNSDQCLGHKGVIDKILPTVDYVDVDKLLTNLVGFCVNCRELNVGPYRQWLLQIEDKNVRRYLTQYIAGQFHWCGEAWIIYPFPGQRKVTISGSITKGKSVTLTIPELLPGGKIALPEGNDRKIEEKKRIEISEESDYEPDDENDPDTEGEETDDKSDEEEEEEDNRIEEELTESEERNSDVEEEEEEDDAGSRRKKKQKRQSKKKIVTLKKKNARKSSAKSGLSRAEQQDLVSDEEIHSYENDKNKYFRPGPNGRRLIGKLDNEHACCGLPIPTFFRDAHLISVEYHLEFTGDPMALHKLPKWNPLELYDFLRWISEEDHFLLGFDIRIFHLRSYCRRYETVIQPRMRPNSMEANKNYKSDESQDGQIRKLISQRNRTWTNICKELGITPTNDQLLKNGFFSFDNIYDSKMKHVLPNIGRHVIWITRARPGVKCICKMRARHSRCRCIALGQPIQCVCEASYTPLHATAVPCKCVMQNQPAAPTSSVERKNGKKRKEEKVDDGTEQKKADQDRKSMPPPKARPLKRAKFDGQTQTNDKKETDNQEDEEEEEEEEDNDENERNQGDGDEEEAEEETEERQGEGEEKYAETITEDTEEDNGKGEQKKEKDEPNKRRKKVPTTNKNSTTNLVVLYRRMCELMIKAKCHELKRKNTFDAVPGSGISLVDAKQYGKSASTWHNDARQNNNSLGKKKSAVGSMSGKEGSSAASITKRSNCNAQFPVAPCVATDIDELMVPEEVFNTITYSRVIHEHNRAECIDRIRSGQVKLLKPSKESIVSYNTEYININSVVPTLNTVLECLMDEYNYGILNRFPTLHKGCFQGLKLLKIPAHKKIDALRVNMLLTKIMGMDFDGDLAQVRPALNPLIAAEIMCLVTMSEQMGSQHGTGSISGLLQNAMVALLLVTMASCKISKDLFCDLLACFHHSDAKTARPLHIRVPQKADSDTDDYDFPEEKMFSGRQLIQQLSPPGFFYAPGVHADQEMKKFHILDGIVVGNGAAGKTEADLGSNSLTFTILQDFGADMVRVWLSGMQRVMNHYITTTGLSIHYEDIVPPETSAFQQQQQQQKNRFGCSCCQSTIDKHVHSYREKWAAIRRDVERALSDPRLARRTSLVPTKKQAFFFEVMEKARQMGRELYNRELNKQIKFTPGSGIHIVDSGSKGSREHLYMMGMCVGIQQYSGSNIMSRGEFFQSTAYKPEAHGYLTESFEEGLTDAGTLHLSSRARHEALVAVQKIPDTGTKSKNLSNYMAEQCVENDGSVRESDKRIIQFYYGDDQIDPAAIERLYASQSPSLWFETPRHVSPPDLIAMVESVQEMYVRMADSLPLDIAPYTFPFNPTRMIARFSKNPYLVVQPNKHHLDVKKEPEQDGYDQKLDNEVLLPWLNQFGYKCFGDTKYFAAHRATLRDTINPWRLRHIPSREKIQELLAEVYKKLYKSRITPYTAVGVAAAQSMCQPLIQSNLKSGHNIAGQIHRGGTDSVDPRAFLFPSPNRLNAVISVADIKNKSTMLVALKQPWSSSQILANACGLRLQARILNDVKKSVEYFSSPSDINEDWVLPSLMLHMDCYKQSLNEGSLTHPLVKITFHKELCRALDITMMEIATIMIAQWKNQASVVHNEQDYAVYVYLYLKSEKTPGVSTKQQQQKKPIILTENDRNRNQSVSVVEKKLNKEKKRTARNEKRTKAVKEVDGSVAHHISSLQFNFDNQEDSKTYLQQRRNEMQRIVTDRITRILDRTVKVTKKGTFSLRQMLESTTVSGGGREYSIKHIDHFHNTVTVCLNISQKFCRDNGWSALNCKQFVNRVMKPYVVTIGSMISSPPTTMDIVMRAEPKEISLRNVKSAVERLLCKTQIRGLANVLFCVPEQINRWKYVPEKGIERSREWALRVTGSNYANLMLFPFVDFERSSTSFVHDVNELMGIEAARICQFETLDIASREGGTNQDLRPLSLIADETTAFPHFNAKMKMTGPNAMTEKGLCTTHESAFLRRSLFRQPANVYIHAAKEGLVDNISSSFRTAIWMGKTTRMGTGNVHLIPEIKHQPILVPSKTWHSLGLSSTFASATAITKYVPPQKKQGISLAKALLALEPTRSNDEKQVPTTACTITSSLASTSLASTTIGGLEYAAPRKKQGIPLSAVAKALLASEATRSNDEKQLPTAAWTLASSLGSATTKLIGGVECVASSLWAHSRKDERSHCWSRTSDESGIIWVPRAFFESAYKQTLIAETRLDMTASQWKFERVRQDKHRANEWSTIESTFQQSILQPIGIEDICPDSLCREHQPLFRQHELTSLEIIPSMELRMQWKTQIELFR